MYKVLLIDIDNTLLDFDKAESHAMIETFTKYNIECTNDNFLLYHDINADLWCQYEKGLVTKEELLTKRFTIFFSKFLKTVNEKEVNRFYLNALSDSGELIENAKEMLDSIKDIVKIYPVTNGVYNTQIKRINKSGLLPYFTDIFISEKIGIQKPKKGFFDYVFSHIGFPDVNEVLLVGDSLTADIEGAIKYGIDSCWFNPHNIKTTVKPKYIIHSLLELKKIIKNDNSDSR